MKFLSVLSFDKRCVAEVSELGMIAIVFQGIEARQDNEEFVLDALTVICNAVPDPQVNERFPADPQIILSVPSGIILFHRASSYFLNLQISRSLHT
jgi:hypothetical protein